MARRNLLRCASLQPKLNCMMHYRPQTLNCNPQNPAGDMLGLGSLTLPAVFARLGWALALAVIVICVLGTLYSGRLFTLLALKARTPAAVQGWGFHSQGL